MAALPFVSVIVVNFNSRQFLADCLASLAQQNYPRHLFEVILVDNASHDGSAEFVRTAYPWVRIVESGKNLGFAGGNNLGLQFARGEWIALLNNDAVADPEWMTASMCAGQSSADVGGVASHIAFRNEPDLVNSTGLMVLRDGRGADRDFRMRECDVRRPRGQVFGGCGAGVFLCRTMIDQIGLFDSDLFMYYEDLDLAWRANRRGWKFVYEPAARVRHVFGGSAGVASPLQTYFIERNRCLVNLRHAPICVAAATFLGLFARCVRALCRAVTNRLSWRHATAHLRAAADVVTALPVAAWQRYHSRIRRENTLRPWLGA